jgi:SAM-dependent methyltransferase
MSIADLREQAGRKFARFVTDTVVPRPQLWRFARPLIRRQFDSLAPTWDRRRSAEAYAPIEVALGAVAQAPRRVLDLGTGTGGGARLVAKRFPDAEVIGADLSEQMVAEARTLTPPDLRIRYEVADASRLPYGDGSFDLVTLANMIPFFDELERVLAANGHAIFAFSAGPETPIYVPVDRLRSELEQRGFADFAEFTAGTGTSLLARKRPQS